MPNGKNTQNREPTAKEPQSKGEHGHSLSGFLLNDPGAYCSLPDFEVVVTVVTRKRKRIATRLYELRM